MLEKKQVTILRFAEFDGVWEIKKLGEIAKFSKGKNLSKIDITEEGLNECVRYGELYTTYNETIDKIHSRTNLRLEDSVLSKANDIIIPASGETQLDIATASCVLKDNVILGGDLNIIRTKNSGVFLSYYLNSKKKIDIARLSQGSSVIHLYSSQLSLLKLNIPQLPEQQKIASFLTEVDTKLSQLTKKKALLENYKKGVMQQIFSQEIRFKDGDGNDYGDWEEKKLGDVGKIVSGLTYSPDDINDDGILVLRSSNVKKRLINLNDNVFVSVNEGKFNPVELNDILICVRNGSKRLIGKNAIIKKGHIGLAFGAFMTVYRSNYNQFLFHFFDSQHYKKEVHKNLGATINSINGGDLKKFKVPFPRKEEQTKIANFLSDLDAKIEVLSTSIENTETFKKGLLQQMFV
jgi:type I restriction enzyme S subunit